MSLTSVSLALIASLAAADGELRVLATAEGDPDPARIVYEHLEEQARTALARRREEFEAVTTPEQLAQWQQARREFFLEQLGGLPERTPLHAEVVGTLRGDGYRIEKIVYESRPRHRVTAVLYLPEGEPPFPAVLVSCGHSRTAKAADYNQRVCQLLVRNGIAAFCYDPIGQGERSQILTPDGTVRHSGTTTEHFLVGVGSILVGTNTAQYRIWDGIRGIDYLAERPDVDAERIGFTGCSGGGTLTSYIMALDDRVACAAPACYITTFGRLIETIGPQDAEQNIFGQVAFGMDQPDYLLMRAPRPTLICATTGDFFDIGGTWDAYRQAKRFYGRMGAPERIGLVEFDGGHGIPQRGREAMVQWMRRWLAGVDEPVRETGGRLWSEEDLRCTPQGQVLLLPDERSVFDLNAQREEQLAEARRAARRDWSDAEFRDAIRRVAGVRRLEELPVPGGRTVEVIERDGYRIDKLVLETEGGIPLPALVFVPAEPEGEAWLSLHGEDKHVDAEQGGAIERLVREGRVVMAVDLRGLGETASGTGGGAVGAGWKGFYLAYLLGQSMVGLRAEDVLVCGRFLAGSEEYGKPGRVHVAGIGEAGVPVLHAAALEPELFASVRLERTVRSWAETVRESEPAGQLVNAVHGALRVYDLPDLLELCGVDTVTVEEAGNVSKEGRGSE